MRMLLLFTAMVSLSSFSAFWASNNFKKPPVELANFIAKVEGEKVLLSWETKSEQHAAYIAVERSADNKNFAKIAKIELIEQHRKGHQYSYTDESPYTEYNYYRLKLVDLDEQFDYSESVSAYIEAIREITNNPENNSKKGSPMP